ncbi:unnamed protein product [Bursaphelenchus okinawaensis]|uniref:Uncharacterized protein n=1 Tax=Bursaphelenchus okinawaensis TaxID=465554 RepID=A0A811LN02_9BILA|nr:unnamed protein product [Bursaphelenchus okinawaensis]CAG9124618.1 unnamed protein product [Bursaphelenchus okinawaensis]
MNNSSSTLNNTSKIDDYVLSLINISAEQLQVFRDVIAKKKELYKNKKITIFDSSLAVGQVLADLYVKEGATVCLVCDNNEKNRNKFRSRPNYHVEFIKSFRDVTQFKDKDIDVLMVILPLLQEVGNLQPHGDHRETCDLITKHVAKTLTAFEANLIKNKGMFVLVGPALPGVSQFQDPFYNSTMAFLERLTESVKRRREQHHKIGSKVKFLFLERPIAAQYEERITDYGRCMIIFNTVDAFYEGPWEYVDERPRNIDEQNITLVEFDELP